MMTIRWILICLTMFSLIAQPISIAAQRSNDWAAVKALGNGQQIRIETKTGTKIDGAIRSVSDDEVSVTVNGSGQDVAFSDVKKLYRVENGSRGPGVAIGTAVGAGAGAAIGVAVNASRGGSDDTASVIWPFIAIGAGVGAIAGAFLRKKKQILVYEAR